MVLNIALPSIAADVDMTAAQMPWAVNAYLLFFGGLLLLGGRLADRCGTRTALLTGVVAFVASSLLGSHGAREPRRSAAARAKVWRRRCSPRQR